MYIEVKHWKSSSKKMSTLGWSYAPIEMFIDASSDQPVARYPSLSFPITDHNIRLHRFMPFKCELLAWQDVYRFHPTPVGDQIMRRLASHIMYQDTHT